MTFLLKDNKRHTGLNGHLGITRGVFINNQDYLKKYVDPPSSVDKIKS